MTSSALLTQVTDPDAIHGYFDWHVQQGVALLLMMASCDGQLPARLTGFAADDGSLLLRCSGVPAPATTEATPYAVIGSTAEGVHFLASGTLQACADTVDGFRLSVPAWIDIAQLRDSQRSPLPAAHFLHFSSIDPHLNDIVCRVQNVSLGGLAVQWQHSDDYSAPLPGALTDEAILLTGAHRISLGKMRVTHSSAQPQHSVLGLQFERAVPRQFDALVQEAQRAQPLP